MREREGGKEGGREEERKRQRERDREKEREGERPIRGRAAKGRRQLLELPIKAFTYGSRCERDVAPRGVTACSLTRVSRSCGRVCEVKSQVSFTLHSRVTDFSSDSKG